MSRGRERNGDVLWMPILSRILARTSILSRIYLEKEVLLYSSDTKRVR